MKYVSVRFTTSLKNKMLFATFKFAAKQLCWWKVAAIIKQFALWNFEANAPPFSSIYGRQPLCSAAEKESRVGLLIAHSSVASLERQRALRNSVSRSGLWQFSGLSEAQGHTSPLIPPPSALASNCWSSSWCLNSIAGLHFKKNATIEACAVEVHVRVWKSTTASLLRIACGTLAGVWTVGVVRCDDFPSKASYRIGIADALFSVIAWLTPNLYCFVQPTVLCILNC